jgi:hypothetical protein
VNAVILIFMAMGSGLFFGVATIVVRVIGDMASDEVRGWLDIAPRAILRLAGARLNREQRVRLYHEEWLPELQYILKEAETRPITRAVRATSFALGLLMAARAVSRLRPPMLPPAVASGVHLTMQSRLIARVAEGDVWEIWDSKGREWVRILA